jgi:hypothetical protein
MHCVFSLSRKCIINLIYDIQDFYLTYILALNFFLTKNVHAGPVAFSCWPFYITANHGKRLVSPPISCFHLENWFLLIVEN